MWEKHCRICGTNKQEKKKEGNDGGNVQNSVYIYIYIWSIDIWQFSLGKVQLWRILSIQCICATVAKLVIKQARHASHNKHRCTHAGYGSGDDNSSQRKALATKERFTTRHKTQKQCAAIISNIVQKCGYSKSIDSSISKKPKLRVTPEKPFFSVNLFDWRCWSWCFYSFNLP